MGESTDRVSTARAALGSLDYRRSDHRVLNVQCRHSHHVAAVYGTEVGLVYQAASGPHAHGSRDFVDTPHGGASRGTEYVDLLVPTPLVADEIPAWCDCGPWTLSRRQLLDQVRAGGGTVHLP